MHIDVVRLCIETGAYSQHIIEINNKRELCTVEHDSILSFYHYKGLLSGNIFIYTHVILLFRRS